MRTIELIAVIALIMLTDCMGALQSHSISGGAASDAAGLVKDAWVRAAATPIVWHRFPPAAQTDIGVLYTEFCDPTRHMPIANITVPTWVECVRERRGALRLTPLCPAQLLVQHEL